jgi:hypothetical protein
MKSSRVMALLLLLHFYMHLDRSYTKKFRHHHRKTPKGPSDLTTHPLPTLDELGFKF